jgi:hypothetical protein
VTSAEGFTPLVLLAICRNVLAIALAIRSGVQL